MTNPLLKSLLLLLPLLFFPLRAHACLNDRYTTWAEKEFRSHYGQSPPQHDTADLPNPTFLWHWDGFALTAAGIAMLLAACAVERRKSAKNPGARNPPIALVALTLIGAFLGFVIASSRGTGSFAASATRYPMAYQLPRLRGGTSLRIAMIHDILHERYPRHGTAWYEEQIREAQSTLTQENQKNAPASFRALAAMDDLAVALERQHKSSEAATIMRNKLTLCTTQPWFKTITPIHIPPFNNPYDAELFTLRAIQNNSPLSPEREALYTTHANLGTFLIHASFTSALAGDKSAQSQLREGLAEIETAIALNPAAHFGREDWQSVAVRHFLASLDDPKLLTRFDLIGNPLYAPSTFVSHNRLYSRLRFPLPPDTLSADDRVGFRFEIPTSGADPTWVQAVHPLRENPRPFDEPTLGILGMWMLGGGPNPHFALTLGTICEQIGQHEIAWEAYERALEMSDRFSPDPKIRDALIAHCHTRQSAIAAKENPANPDAWQSQLRQRHQAELAFGQSWQQDTQAFEANQIAAGKKLDDPRFYDNLPAPKSPASNPGHVDEFQIVRFSAFPFLDALPLSLTFAGAFLLLASFAKHPLRWR